MCINLMLPAQCDPKARGYESRCRDGAVGSTPNVSDRTLHQKGLFGEEFADAHMKGTGEANEM